MQSDTPVALILNAGTDTDCRIARELLAAGRRVAVVGRRTTDVTRVLHGHSWRQVWAIAADTDDEAQLNRVIATVQRRFGRIDSIIDADRGTCGASLAELDQAS
jgi:NADP-dependent 3-hydroxy acid dehydrogenase YdfG